MCYQQLSYAQKRALRNEETNNMVGLVAGLAYFATDEGQPFETRLMRAVGVGLTSSFLSSFLFPVRIKDVLTFEKEGLGNVLEEPPAVKVDLPDGTYEGYQVVYTVHVGSYQFTANWGMKCGTCKIPVLVTVKNGYAYITPHR